MVKKTVGPHDQSQNSSNLVSQRLWHKKVSMYKAMEAQNVKEIGHKARSELAIVLRLPRGLTLQSPQSLNFSTLQPFNFTIQLLNH